jgi:hypothetical protein
MSSPHARITVALSRDRCTHVRTATHTDTRARDCPLALPVVIQIARWHTLSYRLPIVIHCHTDCPLPVVGGGGIRFARRATGGPGGGGSSSSSGGDAVRASLRDGGERRRRGRALPHAPPPSPPPSARRPPAAPPHRPTGPAAAPSPAPPASIAPESRSLPFRARIRAQIRARARARTRVGPVTFVCWSAAWRSDAAYLIGQAEGRGAPRRHRRPRRWRQRAGWGRDGGRSVAAVAMSVAFAAAGATAGR